MHVVPKPGRSAMTMRQGTVMRNHFFMEFVPPPGPDDAAKRIVRGKMVVGVAVHELVHALYDSAPVGMHLSVMRQFVAASDPGAASMYAFVNEAIATAVAAMVSDLARKL